MRRVHVLFYILLTDEKSAKGAKSAAFFHLVFLGRRYFTADCSNMSNCDESNHLKLSSI